MTRIRSGAFLASGTAATHWIYPIMTEADYLTSTSPAAMLTFLQSLREQGKLHPCERRVRLLMVAYARMMAERERDEECLWAITAADDYLNGDGEAITRNTFLGQIRPSDFEYNVGIRQGPSHVFRSSPSRTIMFPGHIPHSLARSLTSVLADMTWGLPALASLHGFHLPINQPEALSLIRDIFPRPSLYVFPPQQIAAARDLARAINDRRDWDAMPVLADKLEEAGCVDEEVLKHCRQATQPEIGSLWFGNPHTRGCWVLEGLMGIE